MQVRIVNRPTGLLNGRDWPDAGEVLEVEDNIGADMCASGIGEPAELAEADEPVEEVEEPTDVAERKVEKAVPTKKAETRKGSDA